jgi:hypothetical protein
MSVHSKAAGNGEIRRLCLCAPYNAHRVAWSGLSNRMCGRRSALRPPNPRRYGGRPGATCNHYTGASSHLDPSQSSRFRRFGVGRNCEVRGKRLPAAAFSVSPDGAGSTSKNLITKIFNSGRKEISHTGLGIGGFHDCRAFLGPAWGSADLCARVLARRRLFVPLHAATSKGPSSRAMR